MLGAGFVIAQYFFYFGGRKVILNTDFDSVIQLIMISGLYLGLFQYRRETLSKKFSSLFVAGLIIVAIGICFRILFSSLLYGVIAPELGSEYKTILVETMNKVLSGRSTATIELQTSIYENIINPFTIAFLEGFSLFLFGVIFSAFIALLMNMFRK